MTGKITTLKLQESTKDRLEKLRSYKRESYDELLQKILDVLNTIIHNPERARSKLILIERQRVSLKRKTKKKQPNPSIKSTEERK